LCSEHHFQDIGQIGACLLPVGILPKRSFALDDVRISGRLGN
jgi:hypothetical protein